MSDTRAPDLQTMVLRLMRFWIDEGCYFLPAYDAPVMAALQHSKVFLGLFETEAPQRTALLQTVRRPRDSRYGAQPYRLAKHLQLQILLSPNPDDVMAIYLRSLRAIGLQVDLHDVRFAESRWEMPALGTWGTGWSVRIDGMGVTRLTLLQAAGGVNLTPVRAEIVYGVERLATCLTGAASAYDVQWAADGPSHGTLHRRDEAERSRQDLELVDVEALETDWRGRLAAADAALDAGLWTVAYEATTAALYTLERQAARGALSEEVHHTRDAELAERVGVVTAALRQRRPEPSGVISDA